MLDVQKRLEQLRKAIPALRLYALVDGVQYQTQLCKRLNTGTGLFPLFAGTIDAALAHAGPWLIDTESAGEAIVSELVSLERDAPSVSWLITQQGLKDLGQLLQRQLDVRLPDGRSALLRFWDPRVLISLARTLDSEQREEFFGHIYEWHMLHDQQRVRIGRQYVEAN